MVGNISSFESMVYREVGCCLRLGKSDMEFDFLGRDLNLSWVQRRIANADKFGFPSCGFCVLSTTATARLVIPANPLGMRAGWHPLSFTPRGALRSRWRGLSAGCQRLTEATQKGEIAVGACCEGQTIRHEVHRRGI
jgi:hypothetical protein